MKKVEPVIADLFPKPESIKDSETLPAIDAVPKKALARKRSKGVAASTGQGYLPGLSRRGRPRLENPVPASERAKASRQRRVAEGDRRLEVLLTADVNRALEALIEHFQEPRAAVIARLIERESVRLQRKKKVG